MSYETEKLAELAGKLPGRKRKLGYKPPVAPAYVYLLAEHLDTVLAAGEDLQALHITWNVESPRFEDKCTSERLHFRRTLASVRTLELALIGRLMRARAHTETLADAESTFRPMAQLFLAGTTPFVDAVAELGESEKRTFDTGGDAVAYIRSRGLIAEDAGAPLDGTRIDIRDDFLIAKRIALGVLMDLVAMFLDTLEIHYTLFDDVTEASGEDDLGDDAGEMDADADDDLAAVLQSVAAHLADATGGDGDLEQAMAIARAALASETTTAPPDTDLQHQDETRAASVAEAVAHSESGSTSEPQGAQEAPDRAGLEAALEPAADQLNDAETETATTLEASEPISDTEIEREATPSETPIEAAESAAVAETAIEPAVSNDAETTAAATDAEVVCNVEPRSPIEETAPETAVEAAETEAADQNAADEVTSEGGEPAHVAEEATEDSAEPDEDAELREPSAACEAEAETDAANAREDDIAHEASGAAEDQTQTDGDQTVAEAAAPDGVSELEAASGDDENSPSEPPPIPGASAATDDEPGAEISGESKETGPEDGEEDAGAPVRMSLAEAIAAVRDGKAS